MGDYSYLAEADLLRRKPTPARWATHLRRLQTGELDDYVRDRGSYEDHVATILAESDDPPPAQTAFDQALRDVLQSWTPTALDRPAEVALLVDLIAAYTPKIGYVKIFAKLDSEEQLRNLATVSDDLDLAYGRDLRRKMLNTLDTYFPTAQPGRDQAYKDYIKVLRAHLLIPRYVGVSARLLFRRGQLNLEENVAVEILRREPSAIAPILREVVKLRSKIVVERLVRALYRNTLRVGVPALKAFDQEVQRLGGRFESGGERPKLILREVGELLLDLPENVVSQAMFLEMRWAKAQQTWVNKETEIRSELRAQQS